MTTGPDDSGDDREVTRGTGPRRLRIALVSLGLLVCAVLVALSPTFGRAEPLGTYRPPVPPDALTNGCYPLPSGVTLGFAYQVRWDGDVPEAGAAGGKRRELALQYDLIDVDAAAAALERSFVRRGFHVVAGSTSRHVSMSKPGVGPVRAVLTPMDPLRPDQIVRGTIVLDLPVAPLASDAPVCSDPASTKRFTNEPPP